LDGALTRATDALLKRKNKRQLIIDLDSTGDSAKGKQEGVACNGHFAKNCFHPLFPFTSEGDCLGSKLRPGNVHSTDGALDFIKPMVKRYRAWFKLFWFRGEAASAKPEIYEYCEEQHLTYFIRLPANEHLDKLVAAASRSSGKADRPRAASRSGSLISTTRPRVGAAIAG
jgi:hypothetical protein